MGAETFRATAAPSQASQRHEYLDLRSDGASQIPPPPRLPIGRCSRAVRGDASEQPLPVTHSDMTMEPCLILNQSTVCAEDSSGNRSEEHTSELQSLMRISYAVFCLKKKKQTIHTEHNTTNSEYQ